MSRYLDHLFLTSNRKAAAGGCKPVSLYLHHRLSSWLVGIPHQCSNPTALGSCSQPLSGQVKEMSEPALQIPGVARASLIIASSFLCPLWAQKGEQRLQEIAATWFYTQFTRFKYWSTCSVSSSLRVSLRDHCRPELVTLPRPNIPERIWVKPWQSGDCHLQVGHYLNGGIKALVASARTQTLQRQSSPSLQKQFCTAAVQGTKLVVPNRHHVAHLFEHLHTPHTTPSGDNQTVPHGSPAFAIHLTQCH